MGVRDVCVYFPQLNFIIVRDFCPVSCWKKMFVAWESPILNLCELEVSIILTQ